MQGGGFEPPKAEPAGLQPAPFGHSGIPAGDAIVAASPAGQIYPPGRLAVVVPATLGAVVGRVLRPPRRRRTRPTTAPRVAVERVPVVCDLRPAVRALDGA